MNTIELLNLAINDVDEDSVIHPPKPFEKGIPTLTNGVYRPASPMLLQRFELIGGWEDASHGDWLDTMEMEIFWQQNIADERLKGIRVNVIASKENWQDDAAGIFDGKRVSVFAGSAYTYERIYLIWFDSVEEPEFWIYDVNGEQRYKDLDSYLQLYINDDLSAVGKKWKLGEL